MADIFNFEQTNLLNLACQCVEVAYVGCLGGEETSLSHLSAQAQADNGETIPFRIYVSI